MKPISIQLYTVRDAAAKDFVGVLKKIASIGYKGVEFAGLHGLAPKEVRKIIDDLGMVTSSSHTSLPTKENVGELVDTAKTLGYTRIITGVGPDSFKTADQIKAVGNTFEAAAKLLPTGFQLGYHNHYWEFDTVDGQYGMEIFLKNAPSVFSQCDVYWASNFGAADPVKFVKTYAKRIPLLHIKDGPLVKGQPHTAAGKGKVNIPAVVGAADPKVLEWLIVELDECATDMMQAVEDSYKYLTGQGLAEGKAAKKGCGCKSCGS